MLALSIYRVNWLLEQNIYKIMSPKIMKDINKRSIHQFHVISVFLKFHQRMMWPFWKVPLLSLFSSAVYPTWNVCTWLVIKEAERTNSIKQNCYSRWHEQQELELAEILYERIIETNQITVQVCKRNTTRTEKRKRRDLTFHNVMKENR